MSSVKLARGAYNEYLPFQFHKKAFVFHRRHQLRKHPEVSAIAFCTAVHGSVSTREELKLDRFRENLVRHLKMDGRSQSPRVLACTQKDTLHVLCGVNSHLACSAPWRLFQIVQKRTMSPCHVPVTPYVLARDMEESHWVICGRSQASLPHCMIA